MSANKIHRHHHFQIRFWRRLTLRTLTLLLSANLAPLVIADNNKEQQVKVSYIYNFAKFIKWPVAIADNSMPFYLCIEGTQPLSGAIMLLQNRLIDGRKIEVRPFAEITKSDNCSVLFIGDSEQHRLLEILQQVSSLPVLTVSDLTNFTEMGGIIGMKVLDNRVRFDINLGAAQKADLKVDSQLLKLALRVVP